MYSKLNRHRYIISLFRINKVLHFTAYHYFLKANANNIFLNVTKRNRFNLRGFNLTEREYVHDFIFSIEDMIWIILSTINWGTCTQYEFNQLIQNFKDLLHESSFKEITLPKETANMTIINRYFTQPENISYTPIDYSRNPWEAQDDAIISQYI